MSNINVTDSEVIKTRTRVFIPDEEGRREPDLLAVCRSELRSRFGDVAYYLTSVQRGDGGTIFVFDLRPRRV